MNVGFDESLVPVEITAYFSRDVSCLVKRLPRQTLRVNSAQSFKMLPEKCLMTSECLH